MKPTNTCYMSYTERELIVLAQNGDIDALNELHNIYCGMVDQIVSRLKNTTRLKKDLKEYGMLLLDSYIQSWDTTLISKPVAYLQYHIRKNIEDYK